MVDGGGKKLNTIGTSIKDIIYITITLIEATRPNSNSIWVSVEQNTANPMEVVTLANIRETPTFSIDLANARILLWCKAKLLWYLLSIIIQFGIPITISRGGISPVRTDILKPNKTSIPTDQTTPTIITAKEKTTGKMERKNKNNIIKHNLPARPIIR